MQFGEGVHEGGEFVDKHHETGQKLRSLCNVTHARLNEHPLTAAQFGLQAEQRSLGDERVEIGHQADRVRQFSQASKGGTPFEVDEQQLQFTGRPVCSAAESERSQEFAFSAAGRAAD